MSQLLKAVAFSCIISSAIAEDVSILRAMNSSLPDCSGNNRDQCWAEAHAADRKYEGEWKQGAPFGFGVIEYQDGRVYNGDVEGGRPMGKGRMSYPNGDSYNGYFELGQRHGIGIMKYESGAEYKGNWSRDKRHGLAEYRWNDRCNFRDGEWKDDQMTGVGYATSCKMPRGYITAGYWERGKLIVDEEIELRGKTYRSNYGKD